MGRAQTPGWPRPPAAALRRFILSPILSKMAPGTQGGQSLVCPALCSCSESPPGLVTTACLKTVSGHSTPKRRTGDLDHEVPRHPLGVQPGAGVLRLVLYVFPHCIRTMPSGVSAVVTHALHVKKSRSRGVECLVQGRQGEDVHPKVLTWGPRTFRCPS